MTESVAGSPTGSLNRARPTPSIRWALTPEIQRRVLTEIGPHSALRACWLCPVCAAAVHRRATAGRHRVYCTNACRQRAYRLRRAARQERPMSAIRTVRPERAASRDRVHAIRDFRDVLTGRRDSVGRGITACGTFARMSIDTPTRFGHTEFRAAYAATRDVTCRRCEQLSGLQPRPLTPGDP